MECRVRGRTAPGGSPRLQRGVCSTSSCAPFSAASQASVCRCPAPPFLFETRMRFSCEPIGFWVCIPTITSGSAACVCNADSTGAPTETGFGGPLCADCAPGYVSRSGRGVADQCTRYEGGECALGETENAIVCRAGQKMKDGACYSSACGKCRDGMCRPIPEGADPKELVPICRPGVAPSACYTLNCIRSTGGNRAANTGSIAVECVCPGAFCSASRLEPARGRAHPARHRRSLSASWLSATRR